MLGLLDELLNKDRGSKTNAIVFQCTSFLFIQTADQTFYTFFLQQDSLQ